MGQHNEVRTSVSAEPSKQGEPFAKRKWKRLLLLLLIPLLWITYRQYRRATLDHALIAAIKARDDKKALEALAEGASGEARDTASSRTFKESLLHLLNSFRHPDVSDNKYLPALLLLYDERIGTENADTPGPDPAVVRALLDHGAQVNDRSGTSAICPGSTPLIYSVWYSNIDVIRILLEHGANVSAKDDKGETALDWVRSDPDASKTAALLRKYGAK